MRSDLSSYLGMNARNYLYASVYNKPSLKNLADSKLMTKTRLRKHGISVPRLYRVFRTQQDVDKFCFERKLEDNFVVKPNKGLGGDGIIVLKERASEQSWLTTQGEEVSVDDIKLHINDIFEGRFHPKDLADFAFIEERIRIHPAFADYAYHGTPDIRVIVFQHIPVMAMLRIPTRESGGRANLHQGAVGAGIDIGAGVTTYAIHRSNEIVHMPESGLVIRGLEIPEWDTVLETAIKCQQATNLGFLGVDIVLQPSKKHKDKTFVKVLELNAQPGLKIQMANKAGLRRRLERVEGLQVDTPEKGIRIGRELFGDLSLAHMGRKIKQIGVFETVDLVGEDGGVREVQVKVDTGAYRTSIDKQLVAEMGLLKAENILYKKSYRNALGKGQVREVIGVRFRLGGRMIETTANVTDRSHMNRPMLVGRRDLKGFVVGFSR